MTKFELLVFAGIILGTFVAGASLLISGVLREVRAHYDRPDD